MVKCSFCAAGGQPCLAAGQMNEALEKIWASIRPGASMIKTTRASWPDQTVQRHYTTTSPIQVRQTLLMKRVLDERRETKFAITTLANAQCVGLNECQRCLWIKSLRQHYMGFVCLTRFRPCKKCTKAGSNRRECKNLGDEDVVCAVNCRIPAGNNRLKHVNFGLQTHFDGALRQASAVVIWFRPILLFMMSLRPLDAWRKPLARLGQ